MTDTSMNTESPLPLYYQLTERLRAQARSLSPGDRFPTDRDIAEQYDVSRFTAIRALKVLAEEGVVKRRQGRGTFVLEPKDDLALQTIHLFVPRTLTHYARTRNYWFLERIQGVIDEAQEHAGLSLVHVPEDVDETAYVSHRIRNSKTGGVVFLQLRDLGDLLAVVKRQRIPYVLLNVRAVGMTEYNAVASNESKGFHDAVDHLVGLGHRRIGFVRSLYEAGVSLPPRMMRHRAFVEAMQRHGLSVPDRWVQFWREDDDSTLRRMLSGPNRPTALVAENDRAGVPVLGLLKAMGLSVPGDVSLVSFDNTVEAEEADITSIDPRAELQGRESIRLLLEIMKQGFTMLPGRWLDPVLVVRGSTAGPAERS